MSVRIIIDSASDITREQAAELKLDVLSLKTRFGDEEYLDGVDMNHFEFYEKLIETEELPKTSQISPYEYQQLYKSVKEAQDTAVCITISSKLSGCYQSANIALDGYEDVVTIIDSENACIGERILVLYAVKLRDEGKSASEIADILNEEKKRIRVIALLDTLEYLKKGGRISSAAAFAGALLSIKPVIAIENGEVVVLGKARGSRNGNNMLIELVNKKGGIDFDKPFCLAYAGLSDAILQKYIKDSEFLYKDKTDKLPVSTIGSTIGTYVGPGAIGAAFFAKE